MRMYVLVALLGLVFCSVSVFAEQDTIIKIQGSTTVNPVVAEAAEYFQREKGWTIYVDTQGGSSGGISAVGEGLVDIGMASKPISEEDKTKYPEADFHSFAIGLDGVALIVSTPVYEAGVHSLSKRQVQEIYEGKINNWKEVGGKNSPIVFYNKEPGRGTWEVFADWAYNGHKNTPLVSHPEVGSNEETRNKVSFHPSAISQLSFAWTENTDKIKALGIETVDGEVIEANLKNIQDGTYPISRKLFVITNGEPNEAVREFIEFLLSEKGQELVKKHGYLPVQ